MQLSKNCRFPQQTEKKLWQAVAGYRQLLEGQPSIIVEQAIDAVMQSHINPFYRTRGRRVPEGTIAFIEEYSRIV